MAEDKEKGDGKKGSGSKKKLIIIIIAAALLLLLIAGGIGGFLFLKNKKEAEEAKKDPGDQVPVPVINQTAEIGPMVDITEFIVNIISEDNTHYVKASLTLELDSEFAKEEADKRMPQIRDAILLLVGNKTYEELHDLQGKRQLKAELLSKINSFLQSGKVKSIYFTDFVVQ